MARSCQDEPFRTLLSASSCMTHVTKEKRKDKVEVARSSAAGRRKGRNPQSEDGFIGQRPLLARSGPAQDYGDVLTLSVAILPTRGNHRFRYF